MKLACEYHQPESWDEAIALLGKVGREGKVLAGGTDLMLQLDRGEIKPTHVISLAAIPNWDSVKFNGSLSISAGTTFRQLERMPGLRSSHAALIDAARQVGGVQIRNVATVAGNFCNASPAADSVPPLIVLDALLTVLGSKGEREIPVDAFITGPGQTILAEGELLKKIHVPELPERSASVFLKAGRRNAMEISIVCVAVRLTLDEGGKTCSEARISVGAVAPTPIRARRAEEFLEGQVLEDSVLEAAAKETVKATSPISDVRASAEYRQYLTGVMVGRAIAACRAQILVDGSDE